MILYLSLVSTTKDKQKVQQVYERYYGLMMHIARRYFPQQSDAQDVVHDAIVKIIGNLKKIDVKDEIRAKAFCAAVVKNTALDKLKAKEHTVAFLEDFADEPIPAEDFAISRDAYNDLVNAVRALDEPYRIVLSLKYVNDLPDKEIAALLGQTESAVSVRLSRARAKLRQALKGGKTDETAND